MKPRAPRPPIGWREWVGLPDLGVAWVKAKVDTGARSSSLHVWDIDIADVAGLVRFNAHPVQDDDTTVMSCTAELIEQREVRSSNGEAELRPVVRTSALLAGGLYEIELTLSRRDEMGFRMLLGRSAIKRRFVVDPARSFLGGGDKNAPPQG